MYNFFLTLAVYLTKPVMSRIGLCLHCDRIELVPPTYNSDICFFSGSEIFLTGGGGAGLDFLCRCLIVPVLLLTECVEGDGISEVNRLLF